MMGALPKALARRGHRVMVVAPRYQNYEEGWETGVRVQLSVGGSTVEVRNLRVMALDAGLRYRCVAEASASQPVLPMCMTCM